MQAKFPPPPITPSTPDAAAGASLASSPFPPSGTDPGHPPPIFLRRAAPGWAPRFPPPQRASIFPLPHPPLFSYCGCAERGEADISLSPQGKLRQERASRSHPRCSRRTPLPGSPAPAAPGCSTRGFALWDRPGKGGATPEGSKFCLRGPLHPHKEGGRREAAISLAMHISARVFLNISGGGGRVVFTGKSGKPR